MSAPVVAKSGQVSVVGTMKKKKKLVWRGDEQWEVDDEDEPDIIEEVKHASSHDIDEKKPHRAQTHPQPSLWLLAEPNPAPPSHGHNSRTFTVIAERRADHKQDEKKAASVRQHAQSLRALEMAQRRQERQNTQHELEIAAATVAAAAAAPIPSLARLAFLVGPMRSNSNVAGPLPHAQSANDEVALELVRRMEQEFGRRTHERERKQKEQEQLAVAVALSQSQYDF